MARSNDRDRKRAPKEGIRKGKKKVDIVARDGIDWVDYKDVNLLRKFMSDRGKIRARRVSGLSTQNQRAVAHAIKLARELALLPYATRTVTERAPRPARQPRSEQQHEASPAEADVLVEDAPEGEVEP
jgi:small subunit ribosomal protein S18